MCCENGTLINPQPAGCFPIELFSDDKFYAPRKQKCFNFVRSMLTPKEKCALGPVEQVFTVIAVLLVLPIFIRLTYCVWLLEFRLSQTQNFSYE